MEVRRSSHKTAWHQKVCNLRYIAKGRVQMILKFLRRTRESSLTWSRRELETSINNEKESYWKPTCTRDEEINGHIN